MLLPKHNDTEWVITLAEWAETFKVRLGDSICDQHSPFVRDNEWESMEPLVNFSLLPYAAA
jgi:hypothetical protein